MRRGLGPAALRRIGVADACDAVGGFLYRGRRCYMTFRRCGAKRQDSVAGRTL